MATKQATHIITKPTTKVVSEAREVRRVIDKLSTPDRY